jgi:hypothetical protein
MEPRRRACKACKLGDCPDCINHCHPDKWCEHRCKDEPTQLSFDLVEDRSRPVAVTSPPRWPAPPAHDLDW